MWSNKSRRIRMPECDQIRQDSTNKREIRGTCDSLHVLIYGNMSRNRRKFLIIWRIKGQINRVITLSFGPLVFIFLHLSIGGLWSSSSPKLEVLRIKQIRF
ncbi:unnamed protein product [Arabidopsis thaliana]|uniref:Transmembrane protein n=1 Tax=Arabidopsis thaliana TaxID=3702 RepID=Q9FGT6_ARATH|nr:unnamed protein product [Arabidopsis thaliana]